jgi:hypothetical protein
MGNAPAYWVLGTLTARSYEPAARPVQVTSKPSALGVEVQPVTATPPLVTASVAAPYCSVDRAGLAATQKSSWPDCVSQASSEGAVAVKVMTSRAGGITDTVALTEPHPGGCWFRKRGQGGQEQAAVRPVSLVKNRVL